MGKDFFISKVVVYISIWGVSIWLFSILCLFALFSEDTIKSSNCKSIFVLLLYSLITTIFVVLLTFSQCSDNINILLNSDINSISRLKELFGMTFRAFLEVTFISILLYRRGLKGAVDNLSRRGRYEW